MSFDTVLCVFEEALKVSNLPRLQAVDAAYRRAGRVAHPDKGGSSEAMHFLHEMWKQRRRSETGFPAPAEQQSLFHCETGSDIVRVGREMGKIKTLFVTRNCEVEVSLRSTGEPVWEKRYIDAYPWTIRVVDGKLLVGREQIALGEETTVVTVKVPKNLYLPVNLLIGVSPRRISNSYRFWPGEEMLLPFDLNCFRNGTLHIATCADLHDCCVLNLAAQYAGPTAEGRHSFCLSPDESGLLLGMGYDAHVSVVENEQSGLATTQVVMSQKAFNTTVVWNVWQREPALRTPHQQAKPCERRKRKRNNRACPDTADGLPAIDGTLLRAGESCSLVVYKVGNRKASWTLLSDAMLQHRNIDPDNVLRPNVRLLSGIVLDICSKFFTFVPTDPPPSSQGYLTDLQQLSQTWRQHFATGKVVLSRTYQLCKPVACEPMSKKQ